MSSLPAQPPATPAASPLHRKHEHELELAVLEEIYNRERVRQRDLADAIGASLGMTNAIVKRLSRKGLLTIRKVNNRNVAYAVTPDGLEAIARKSYRYLKRTIRSVVGYRDALEALVLRIKREGYDSVVVLGGSDLAFMLEHLCAKYGLCYCQRKQKTDHAAPEAPRQQQFYLYAEHIEPRRRVETAPEGHDKGSDYLARVLVSAAAEEPRAAEPRTP